MKPVLFAAGDSGVYAIINVVTGRIYVGSSWKLRHRRSGHFTDLRCGRHDNVHLQRGFKQYGEAAFIWSVVEYCHPDLRIEREQFWIDHFRACEREFGYNIRTRADMQLNADETKAKIKEKRKLQTIKPRTAYTFKSPEGALFTFRSLRAFCERAGLTYHDMASVSSGGAFSSKGWTFVSKFPASDDIPDAKDLEISDEDRVRWSALKTKRPPKLDWVVKAHSKRRMGVPLSEKWRLNQSKARMGMKFSTTHKANISKVVLEHAASDPLHGTKFTYTLKSPEGVIFFVQNLRRFCGDTELPYDRIRTIVKGQVKVSMGWSLISKGGRGETPTAVNPSITAEMKAGWAVRRSDYARKRPSTRTAF